MAQLPQDFFNHDAQAGGFFPLAHVGIQVESIGNRQNTLIEGIRGTGKTHILKMLKRYHLSNFSKNRILPVYVSLAEVSEHGKKDPDEFRIQLYARIVVMAIETLEANKHHLSPNRGVVTGAVRMMLRAFGLDGYLGLENIDKSIEDVKLVADELLFKLNYDISAADLKSYTSSSREKKQVLGGGVKVSAPIPKLGSAEADISGRSETNSGSSETHEETVKILGSRLAHRNASQFIITFLQQIQIILDLKYTLILLDECSEAAREAQVEIFRFFKAIRGSTSKMSDREDCAFFVGSVYPSAETHYPNRSVDGFSFEPGQDCGVEFIQWDETEPETYINFFEQMLVARAKAVVGFEGETAKFVSTYYDRRMTFNLLAFCAGGTPRRFWELNKRSYDAGTNRVSYARAKIAIQEIVNEQVLGHSSLSATDHSIVQHIIKILTKKNEEARLRAKSHAKYKIPQGIYFSATQAHAGHLSRLIMQGAIYDKSRMKSRRHSLRPQPIFALDTSVAFSYRVIPEKGFDLVAESDFPKSTENGFASAASFEPPIKGSERAWTIDSLFVEEAPPGKRDVEEKVIEVTSQGAIKSIRPNGNAFTSVLDGGPDAFISRVDMNKLIELGAMKGTAVSFSLSVNSRGRQAKKLAIIEHDSGGARSKLTRDLEAFIQNLIREEGDMVLARVAHELRNHFGDELGAQGWMGYSKLSQLLSSLSLRNVQLDLETVPGYARMK